MPERSLLHRLTSARLFMFKELTWTADQFSHTLALIAKIQDWGASILDSSLNPGFLENKSCGKSFCTTICWRIRSRRSQNEGKRSKGRKEEKERSTWGRQSWFFLYGKPARNISSRNPWSTQTPTRLETEDQKRTSVCGDWEKHQLNNWKTKQSGWEKSSQSHPVIVGILTHIC